MQIFLNGKEIKFTLSDEHYVSDILVKIKPWLIQNGFLMETVAVDHVIYHQGNISQLAGKEISAVDKLEITAYSKLELEFIQYTVIKNYFTAIIGAIDSKNTTKLKNLASSYDEIRQTLSLSINFADKETNQNLMDTLMENPENDENRIKLRESAESIIRLCEAGLGELDKFKKHID